MKKIFTLIGLWGAVFTSAQVNLQSAPNASISQENPFIDASGYRTSNNNVGKGLYFPTTNLTTWEFKTSNINPGKFSNYFDGMVVYNSGTGLTVSNTSKGGKQVSVTPGFYYFKNPNQTFPTGSVANGEWVRLSSDGGVSTNLYTSDGTLAGNRTVTLGANNLVFKGAGNIGVGTDAPTTKLDVAGAVKIADGTQGEGKVLVSNSEGKASWRNLNQIQHFSMTSTVDPNVLGYFPDYTKHANTAASTISYNGKTATKYSIIREWTDRYGVKHSYAVYTSPTSLTWYDAYYMTQSLGGYLATFTSDEEWKEVDANILNNTELDGSGLWIGMVKYSWYAGNALTPDPELKWITGEQPYHDYSAGGTSAVRKVNWFNDGLISGGDKEPNNSVGVEGFVHVYAKNAGFSRTYGGYTTTHPWNDVTSDNPNQLGFIIEFVTIE
ncbi:hypothetical protein PG614_08900 [Riemerella anatipestifer]|nr:hypothetical protein [Riemerella anatipestifer]MDY3533657.1 hypothetical protein [Riemerella anatipestifer]MDY3536062.1 hypothetical protein [Riemerella anatipestifer]